MYIGTQTACRNETDIQLLAQLGVRNVDQTPQEPWEEWTTELLVELRERFDKHGINLEMIHVLPGRAVILGQDPERDAEIEEFKRLIEIAGRSGLRGLK